MKKSLVQDLLDSVPPSLELILAQRRDSSISPSDQDREIIGNLLQTLHETEATLDEAFVDWILPNRHDPFRKPLEELISYIHLSEKIKFANKIGLLEGVKSNFKNLQEQRNHFAHRRTNGNRPHEIFSIAQQKAFVDNANKIRNAIRSNLKAKSHIRHSDFINSVFELFKDIRGSKS